jgi:hypothetical protein
MCDPITYCSVVSLPLIAFVGITQSIISNQIAFLALGTIYFRKIFDVLNNKPLAMTVAICPSVACLLSYVVYLFGNEFAGVFFFWGYYLLRTISIGVNVLTCQLTIYIAWRITRKDHRVHQSQWSQAIWALVQRLLYYPAVQVISTFCLSWYGLPVLLTNRIDDSAFGFTLLCFAVATAPSCAVGYLIIFLKMQPRAWLFLVSRVTTGRRYNKPLAGGEGGGEGNSAAEGSSNGSKDAHEDTIFNHREGAESASASSVFRFSKSSLYRNEYMNLEDNELLQRVVKQQQSFNLPEIQMTVSNHLGRRDFPLPIL